MATRAFEGNTGKYSVNISRKFFMNSKFFSPTLPDLSTTNTMSTFAGSASGNNNGNLLIRL